MAERFTPTPDYFDFTRIFGSLAPQGLPWQEWRRSENVEDQSLRGMLQGQARQVPASGIPQPGIVSGIHHPTTLAGGLLSQQAGYNDISKAGDWEALLAAADMMGARYGR